MHLLRSLLSVLAVFAVSLAALGQTPVAPSEPLLTVVEDLGVRRAGWPLTIGFPFPPATVTDPATLHLVEPPSTQPIPVQARALSRWPDGSLRWVLLDAAVDLSPNQRRAFRVRTGAPVRPATSLTVADKDDVIAVDTGKLRFTVPKKKLALLDAVQLEGKALLSGPITSFVRLADEREAPRPPKSVRVVENGPLRVRLEVRGDYADGIEYVIRVDAFAGQAFVRVLHTFENHRDDAYTAIREIGLDVPVQLSAGASYVAGRVGGDALRGRLSMDATEIAQLDNETLRLNGKPQRGRVAGWVDLRDDDDGVTLAARYFWQEYPQSLSLRRAGVTYSMWSPAAPPAIAGMGAAKTHELIVSFRGAAASTPPEMNAFVTPLVGRPDARWVRDSGALPQALARSPETEHFLDSVGKAYARYHVRTEQEQWDDSGQITCASGAREVRRRGAYGMWNWGDWNFPGYHDDTKGCDAWGNLEYDLTQVLALAFAATADRAFFDGMVVAARHFMDVDVVHHQRARPNWVGMNHPKNPLHFTFEMGGVDLGHTWNEGLLSYYYLTGDERGRDAALGIADYLEKRIRTSAVRGNPRQWGWPQIALVAAFEATGEARYRTAAEAYARGGMRAHPASAAHWKYGILADALAYTHALTADVELEKELRAWLTAYAAAAREAGVRDPRFFPAIAYVGKLAVDATAVDAARAAVERLRLGAWGKPFTLAGRIGFRILSLTTAAPRPSQTARASARPK